MRGHIYGWSGEIGVFPAHAANDSVYKIIEGGWIVPYVILRRAHIDEEYNVVPGSAIAIAGIGSNFIRTAGAN